MKRMRQNQKGFTVIELLISTMVFAVILMIVSYAIIGLTRQFYRGLNQSKTQETARAISEEIAKNIQYSKTIPIAQTLVDDPDSTPPVSIAPGVMQSWCIAERTYAYVEGRRLGDVPAVLTRSNGCTTQLPPLTLDAGEAELLGENMRLSNLEISSDSSGKVWTVRVRVAYGIDDSLTDPLNGNARCKTEVGQQFCAVAEYSTVIVRRL